MLRQSPNSKGRKSDSGVQFNSGLAQSLQPRNLDVAQERKARGAVYEREHLAQRWQIHYSELKFGESKARGAYGEVFEGQYRKGKVAIKVYDFRGSLREAQQEEIWREAALMEGLRSEYLVGFRGLCFDPRYCLVMEYCEGGTLRARLDAKQEIALPMQLRWAMQISYGVYQLHRVRIIHRDLKAENILLDAQGHAKVADFGLSVMKSGSASQSKSNDKNGVGTLPWMAPELFQGHAQTPSADVYSLGMVLWEIISRQLPFQGVMPAVIAGRVALGHREIILESCPLVFKTLIQACWEVDLLKRPTAEQVGEACQAALDRLEAMPTLIAESSADLALERLPEPAAKRRLPSSVELEVKSEAKESRLSPRPTSCPVSAWPIKRLGLFLLLVTVLLTSLFWVAPLLASSDVALKSSTPPWRDYNDSIVAGNSSSALVISHSSSAPTDLFSPKRSPSRDDKLTASALALQTQLITACERGDLSAAKLTILQGAELLNVDPQAKQPLAAAVWAMNGELIDFLIFTAQLKGAPLMTWDDCEKHNQRHYGKIFGVTLPNNLYQVTYGDWVQLLSQMDAFPGISQLHLESCQKVWEGSFIGVSTPRQYAVPYEADRIKREWQRKWDLSQVSSWENLKAYAKSCAAYPPPRKCLVTGSTEGVVRNPVDTEMLKFCLERTREAFSQLQTRLQQKITEAVQAVEKTPVSFRP